MKCKQLYALILLLLWVSICSETVWGKQVSKNDVTISYEIQADSSIKVLNIWNKSSKRVILYIDNKESKTINRESSAQVNQIARQSVRFDYPRSSGALLWRYVAPKVEAVSSSEIEKESVDTVTESLPRISQARVNKKQERQPSKQEGVVSESYLDRMNRDEFFGIESVQAYIDQVDRFSQALLASQDKKQFVIDYDLDEFLKNSIAEINQKRIEIPIVAQEIVAISKTTTISGQETLINYVVETLNNRLRNREDAYNQLNDLVTDVYNADSQSFLNKHDLLNYGLVGGIVLFLVIVKIIAVNKRKKGKRVSKNSGKSVPEHQTQEEANAAIVVRRKTTSVLKKQSLDDVVNNPDYLMIDSADFSNDSAVRRIYIKNTCIKDVYNLYAEDLRNADNPKEDGCMVLGRWVQDEATHTYDVSLEYVVFPGDDAVFKEYELNFGGKIKLRIAEKLRKLRKDTNLQYDLTCWIHSHPGLGVFFSNSDSNVQMQLKHSQHPNFLVAFVVDILTSNQELGIFTFRGDGTINSKGDLLKMYSLEEMYKWALGSERKSFIPDNFYNILKTANARAASCFGIEVNNNAIIDLTQITIEPNTGLVGWAVGFPVDTENGKEYIVSSLVRVHDRPATGVVGCLVSITHMSLPTIQRLIIPICADIDFVLVYSSKLMTLTSIPVVNGDVVMDERFYGDVNIDELKIWTRRKR